MSPLSRQSTIFLPPSWTGETNSDPFWIDGVVSTAFYEESLRFFEGIATSLEGPVPLYTDHPLLSLDGDNLPPPPAFFGGIEGIDAISFAFAPSTMSSGAQPDELYVAFSSSCRYRSQLLTAFQSSIQLPSHLLDHLGRAFPG